MGMVSSFSVPYHNMPGAGYSFPKCALDETNFKEMTLWKLIVIAVHLSKIRWNKKILDQFCDGNRKQNKTNKQIDLCIEKTWK